MLQQTQVSTVIPYYQKFIARFPNINALANCELDELLHYWSGLGYYARARNLHATARIIMTQYAGNFPNQFTQVLALPGIGRSTAGAILAFAWEQRYPILDGNVKRVLTRFYAIAGYPNHKEVAAKLWSLADRLTPAHQVSDYTQALMDLGAGVCTRKAPACGACPLSAACQAYQSGTPSVFPHPKPKVIRPHKSVIMLVVQNPRAEILLVKRPALGIWGGLWSLPECPAKKTTIENAEIEAWCAQQFGLQVTIGHTLPKIRHSFTHFTLDILALSVCCTKNSTMVMDGDQYLWYNLQAPPRIGLPSAITRILNSFA